jgi:hypothetical protein
VVLEAGVFRGVPNRVVQSGRALEGDFAIQARGDVRGDLVLGREQVGLEPAGAQLGVVAAFGEEIE